MVPNLILTNLDTQLDMDHFSLLLVMDVIKQFNALMLIQTVPSTPRATLRSYPDVFWLIHFYP